MKKNKPPTEKPPTKRQQKQLERIVESNQARQHNEQEPLIALRPLVMCGIPLRRPKEAFYLRKSGPYVIELYSSPNWECPTDKTA